MRTYEKIYRDYCSWLVKITGNLKYDYDTFVGSRDDVVAKAVLFKSILNLCYDPIDGIYYFCKFILGDLRDIGFPQP